MTIDPHTLEIVPDLAESVRAESALVHVAILRRDLTFSDGTPLRARDVVSTFEGLADPALGSVYARNYARLRSVVALDDRTVRFELDAPHATFLTDLEVPVVRAEDAHRRLAWRERPPIGAGPYVLGDANARHVTLEANPRWHGGVARHPRVQLDVVRDDNTRALRLLGGRADAALNAVPPLLLPLFEDDERFEVRAAPGIGTTYLGFHTERVPLQVRQAIAHAIDRAALVETKLGGRAALAESWIPRDHWADASLDPTQHDPEAARALLREQRPDRPLLLRVSADRFRVSIARAIAAMLREVGVTVDVRPSEPGTLIADLNEGRFDLCLLQVPEVIEPHVLSWFFASDRVPGVGNGGANRWRLRDPALDALLERGRTASDRADRVAIYHDAQRRLRELLPVLPLWQEESVLVVRRGLALDTPRDGRLGVLAR